MSDVMGVNFGFKKMIIALTEVGKVLSVSSIDGSVLW